MHVGMMFDSLAPGVQNAQETDARAEAFRIRRDFERCLGTGPEQQIVKRLLVGIGHSYGTGGQLKFMVLRDAPWSLIPLWGGAAIFWLFYWKSRRAGCRRERCFGTDVLEQARLCRLSLFSESGPLSQLSHFAPEFR